jgi:phosphatidylserine decarboxylase
MLRFLYTTLFGRVLLKPLTMPFVSKAAGILMDSRLSALFVKSFIEKNGIDMSDYEKRKFFSFNDFFTRSVLPEKRPIAHAPSVLISPCDAKLSAYIITDKSVFSIKDSSYSVADLLSDAAMAKRYSGGYCLIFRLAVDDYHRYCYFDGGRAEAVRHIGGEFHTVQPIALRHCDIYKRNTRECTVLLTENFGTAVQVEVGAMMVGRICNNGASVFRRGEEKGRFEFGGSTIVLLLEHNSAQIDREILRNTENGLETVVKMGEAIGRKA